MSCVSWRDATGQVEFGLYWYTLYFCMTKTFNEMKRNKTDVQSAMNDEVGCDVKSNQIRHEYLTQLVCQLLRIHYVHLSGHKNAANHVATKQLLFTG